MYAGDVTPQKAYDVLCGNEKAVLVDVRTAPEWAYVGLPLVERLISLSWKIYPSMQPAPDFAAQLAAHGVTPENEIFLLCRSGARSAAAATALTRAGFQRCYNVEGGFEGDLDAHGHRGCINGWKAAGLPWRQS